MTSPPKASTAQSLSVKSVPKDNLCLGAIAADVATPAEREREKGLLGQAAQQ